MWIMGLLLALSYVMVIVVPAPRRGEDIIAAAEPEVAAASLVVSRGGSEACLRNDGGRIHMHCVTQLE
jgi:hypothetical protein